MVDRDSRFEESIAALVAVTDAFLRGEFEEELPEIDAEGMLSVLAGKINTMLQNLKSAQPSLANAGAQAPDLVSHARDVVELMEEATGTVLDKSDRLIHLAGALAACWGDSGKVPVELEETRRAVYEIIASQSYQDAARQKMEKLIADLDQMRDYLLEALVVLNIRKNPSQENLTKKRELLREVHSAESSPTLKQDLVDDLLAEFGF